MTPSEVAWRAWYEQHSWVIEAEADAEAAFKAAYALGVREGVRQNAQLGISTLVQQLSVVLERLEDMQRRLEDAA